jgi:HAD superfamily hydrolase (TIGR01509 family)
MVKAVIFDLDGLMVDSEKLALRAWNDLLGPSGIQLSEAQYHHLIGRAHTESVQYVIEQTGVDIPFEVLDQDFWRRLTQLIGQDLSPMPGLIPLLQELHHLGVPLAVASNSLLAYVQKALERTGVRGFFSCVIGVDQVARPKPAPDVYLAAAECLEMSPADCLAIEDSQSGSSAALAAGMACVLIPHPGSAIEVPEGVLAVFPTLIDLHAQVGDLLGLADRTRRP